MYNLWWRILLLLCWYYLQSKSDFCNSTQDYQPYKSFKRFILFHHKYLSDKTYKNNAWSNRLHTRKSFPVKSMPLTKGRTPVAAILAAIDEITRSEVISPAWRYPCLRVFTSRACFHGWCGHQKRSLLLKEEMLLG